MAAEDHSTQAPSIHRAAGPLGRRSPLDLTCSAMMGCSTRYPSPPQTSTVGRSAAAGPAAPSFAPFPSPCFAPLLLPAGAASKQQPWPAAASWPSGTDSTPGWLMRRRSTVMSHTPTLTSSLDRNLRKPPSRRPPSCGRGGRERGSEDEVCVGAARPKSREEVPPGFVLTLPDQV